MCFCLRSPCSHQHLDDIPLLLSHEPLSFSPSHQVVFFTLPWQSEEKQFTCQSLHNQLLTFTPCCPATWAGASNTTAAAAGETGREISTKWTSCTATATALPGLTLENCCKHTV